MPPPDSLAQLAVRPVVADLQAALQEAGLDRLESLSARGLGAVVTDHRSSFVRRLRLGELDVFVKTYRYSSLRERLKGVLRTTWLARSRPAREYDALTWLAAHGFPAPRALAAFESRRLGFLEVAVLVTEAWRGAEGDLDSVLPRLEPAERARCLATLERLVAGLHAAGFRDRNFDLRNVLARRSVTGAFELAKIDSPRFVLVAPGVREDRLTRADRARIARSLAALRSPPAPAGSCPPRGAGTSPRST